MRAQNLAEETVRGYSASALQLDAYLRHGSPEPSACTCAPCSGRADLPRAADVEDVTKAHVQAFVGHLAATEAASTASNRYRALQQFFGWAVDEDEIDRTPMDRMSAPIVPEQPVPVVEVDAIKALYLAWEGSEQPSPRPGGSLDIGG
jgi:site-specific recombinase XerC